eukprot:1143508-Pelagomonas_calceolata.AAC.2
MHWLLVSTHPLPSSLHLMSPLPLPQPLCPSRLPTVPAHAPSSLALSYNCCFLMCNASACWHPPPCWKKALMGSSSTNITLGEVVPGPKAGFWALYRRGWQQLPEGHRPPYACTWYSPRRKE